ncbi:DUF222 domain-containing protein [Actinoplanes sp. NEAU-A12]|uniref:DUF222 domain-containing protein n=1 Tax=Actinoplanes sandaracinus TaxID=3045177 RepID=A0ABT6WM00_9ACTN|nr:DUF222 domain-containing protein [Actinoplanes sandaracinus]
MQEMMRKLADLAGQCAAMRMTPLPRAELLDFLDGVHAAQQMLQAAVLHAVREADRRGVPAAQQAPSPTAWLRARLRISPRAANRLLAQATAVDRNPLLDEAVTAGKVNAEQLAVITTALASLPTTVPPHVRGQAGAVLTDWATHLDPLGLRTAGRRILDHVAPEVAEAVEEEWLRRTEQQAHAQRYLTLSPLGDGRVRVRGLLDTESAAIVTAALDPLCKPDPQGKPHSLREPNRVGRSRSLCEPHSLGKPDRVSGLRLLDEPDRVGGSYWRGGPDHVAAKVAVAAEPAGTGEARTPGQRRADALTDVCRLVLAGSSLPDNGGDRPQLAVTVAYDPLREKLGTARLDDGEPLSAEAVRRLGCDARILPLVLNGHGQILDAGRTRRTATGPMRRALAARDQGCVFPGCGRPPRWCDAHHIISWTENGPTDLGNLALLCGHHHRVVHGDSGWELRVGADGLPEFLPPAWLDPNRRPRRNEYHRRPEFYPRT